MENVAAEVEAKGTAILKVSAEVMRELLHLPDHTKVVGVNWFGGWNQMVEVEVQGFGDPEATRLAGVISRDTTTGRISTIHWSTKNG